MSRCIRNLRRRASLSGRKASTTALLIALFAPTTQAGAATIAVDTTDDAVALDSGCSLREAVTAANTNAPFMECPTGEGFPVIDEIELPVGVYSLTIDDAGEDLNAGGDLDITESVVIRGLGDDFVWWDDPITKEVETLDVWGDPGGFPRTFEEENLPQVVIQNGLGKRLSPGDGDRVIHVLASAAPTGLTGTVVAGHPGAPASPEGPTPEPLIRFENLAIAYGDGFCSGASCDPGAGGILHDAAIDLELFRVALFANRIACFGVSCGQSESAAAVRATDTPTGAVSIAASVIASNASACADSQCSAGGIANLDRENDGVQLLETLITGNSVECTTSQCELGPSLETQAAMQLFEQTVVTGNLMSCITAGAPCSAAALLELRGESLTEGSEADFVMRDSEVSANELRCEGEACIVGGILVSGHTGVLYERWRVHGNEMGCLGAACSLALALDFPGGIDALTMEDIELTSNSGACSGADCGVSTLFHIAPLDSGVFPLATLEGVAINENSLLCEGLDCSSQSPFALQRGGIVTDLSADQNSTQCFGDYCYARSILRFGDGEDGFSGGVVVSGLTVTDNQSLCSGTPCSTGTRCTEDDGACDPGTGGAVELGFSGSSSLFGATITGNTTSGRGGGLVTLAPLQVNQSVISGNTAGVAGGGIFNGFLPAQGESIDPATIQLADTVVENNMTNGNGGGIFNPAGAQLTVQASSSIVGNTAADGGGVFNEGTISGDDLISTITGNTPNQCVNSDAGSGCPGIFADGFESGDTTAWSETIP